MKRRILIISDTHCGHLTGLTPPPWQIKAFKKSETKRNKWAKMQAEAWARFKAMLIQYGPFDIGFHLGDAMDGKGKKSGGVEQITCDMDEQADMSADVCNTVRLHARKGFKWYGVYGTNYHVSSDGDNWDVIAANRAGFEKMGVHEWVDVNGLIFDLKHKVGNSTVPYGKGTPIAKARFQNLLWSEMDAQPKSHIFLRGHTHSTFFVGEPGSWMALICPSLQGWTKYGGLECESPVHWGITIFEVESRDEWGWHVEKVVLQSGKSKAIQA